MNDPEGILVDFYEASLFGPVHGLKPSDYTRWFWSRFEYDRIPVEDRACRNCGLVMRVRQAQEKSKAFCGEDCYYDWFAAFRRKSRAAGMITSRACAECATEGLLRRTLQSASHAKACTLRGWEMTCHKCGDDTRMRAIRVYTERRLTVYSKPICVACWKRIELGQVGLRLVGGVK